MMKRTLLTIALITLSFTLVGCGSADNGSRARLSDVSYTDTDAGSADRIDAGTERDTRSQRDVQSVAWNYPHAFDVSDDYCGISTFTKFILADGPDGDWAPIRIYEPETTGSTVVAALPQPCDLNTSNPTCYPAFDSTLVDGDYEYHQTHTIEKARLREIVIRGVPPSNDETLREVDIKELDPTTGQVVWDLGTIQTPPEQIDKWGYIYTAYKFPETEPRVAKIRHFKVTGTGPPEGQKLAEVGFIYEIAIKPFDCQ